MQRRRRLAIAAVFLMLCLSLWTASFLPSRHPLSKNIYSGASSPAKGQTDSINLTSPRIPGPYKITAYKAPPTPPRPLLVLHWTEQNNTSFYFKVNTKSFSDCPVNNCEGTAKRNLLSKADVVLFNGRKINMTDLPKWRKPWQRFVFVIRESPKRTYLPLKELDGFFNLTMTYCLDADVPDPYGQTAEGKQAGMLPFFHLRRRPVAWMVSHCKTNSQREQYVSQLQHHLPVDTFGGCGDKRCPGKRPDCYRHLADTHLFYLSFENSLCDDYITEKFWLALQVGMVPVVRGPPPEAYRRVAPPNSFIHVEDFAGPKELAGYLLSLAQNQSEYDQYHTWRRSHQVKITRDLCGLCSKLGGRSHNQAVQLSKVWSAEAHCRKPSDFDTSG